MGVFVSAYANLEKIEDPDDGNVLLHNAGDCAGAICTEVCEQILRDLKGLRLKQPLENLRETFRWAVKNNGVVVLG